jgi:tetratricopeptide (TPR) repeat protein
MNNRLAWISLVTVYGCGLTVPSLDAQPAQPEKPAAETISIDELLDRALSYIRQAEARGPDAQDAFRKAREIVETVLARDRFHRRASYYRARLLVLADRSQEALGIIQRWVASPEGENDWEAHLLLGRLYQEGGFNKLAIPSLKTALSLNPRSPRILTELARCEANVLEYNDAARHARQAIDILGPEATAAEYTLLARILSQSGELDEAEQEIVIALNSARSAARDQGAAPATLDALSKALELAVRIKEARLQTDRQSPELYLELARLSRERGHVAALNRANEALEWAKRGIDSTPVAPPILYLEAIELLNELGRTAEAKSLAQQMLEAHPDHPRARELAGDSLGESAPESEPPNP